MRMFEDFVIDKAAEVISVRRFILFLHLYQFGLPVIHSTSLASASSIAHKFAKVSSAGSDLPRKYSETVCCPMPNLLAISVCVNPLCFMASIILVRIWSSVIILQFSYKRIIRELHVNYLTYVYYTYYYKNT